MDIRRGKEGRESDGSAVAVGEEYEVNDSNTLQIQMKKNGICLLLPWNVVVPCGSNWVSKSSLVKRRVVRLKGDSSARKEIFYKRKTIKERKKRIPKRSKK